MIRIRMLIAALLIASVPLCSKSWSTELFPALRGGQLGYSDQKGEIRIPCTFARTLPGIWGDLLPSTEPQVFEFREGVAVVSDGEKCGVIDTSGRWVFVERYDHIDSFNDGISIVHKDSAVGFLRRDGNWLIRPQFQSARPFSEGMAAVSLPPSKIPTKARGSYSAWGFVNVDGEIDVPIKFFQVMSFQEGIAAAQESPHDKWGFIDGRGEWALKPQFDRVMASFFQGLAIVERNGRVQFVDRSGADVFALPLESARPFSEGLAACSVMTPLGRRVGFINRKGKFAISPRFLASGSFSEGLCAVRLPAGCAYINHSGSIVVPIRRVVSAGPFTNGVASIMISVERRAFLFRDGGFLVEDENETCTEADSLDDDAVGLSEEELRAQLAERQWQVNVQELPMRELPTHITLQLPQLRAEASLKRFVTVENGVRHTWWLTVGSVGGNYQVFHNRATPSRLIEAR
jgi:hypothetical protein